MFGRTKYVASVLGAAALTGTLLTQAFASHGNIWTNAVQGMKTTTNDGNLKVTGVLRVKKNQSVYGHLYAHNGLQIWSGAIVKGGGLTVSSGGIKTQSLESSGPISAQSATISGNLTAAGAVSGATVTATGKITGNGLDAGAGAITGGSLTTTGDVTGGNIKANGNLTSTGNLSALTGTFQNMTVTGNVNFTNASVTGLNVGGLASLDLGTPSATTPPLNLSSNSHTVALGVDASGALTVPSLVSTVGTFQSLQLGSSASTVSPLILTENGHTAPLGVDASGNVTVSNLLVSGTATLANLNLTGTGGLTSGVITAPDVTNTHNPGPLTLTGNGITLVGATTINGAANVTGALTLGNDLNMTNTAATNTTGPVVSHILSNGDIDVAGVKSVVLVAGSGTEFTNTVCFTRAFSAAPIVTVTPAANPQGASYWVTAPTGTNSGTCQGTAQGFTIHVSVPAVLGNGQGFTLPFNYHVIGS